MKSKCSFIFKAGTSLVLALLMLFGTVTTSVAAVVDNAEVAADTDDIVDTGAVADVADEGADPTGFTSGTTVYLNSTGGDDWSADGSKGVAAYFYNSDSDKAWTVIKAHGTDIAFTVPGSNKTWAHVIFVRFNTSVTVGSTGSWSNKWGQTGDLDYQSDKNKYKAYYNGGNDAWSKSVKESSATLSASSTSITTAETSTLTPGIYGNTTYNVFKSATYSVTTNPGSAGSVTSAGVFSATAAGTYVVTATVTYNAKGFPGATATATATKSITVTAPTTPSIDLSTDKDTLYIGGGVTDTATITTTKANTTATPSYSVTRNGSAATANTDYTFNTSTGVFTPKKTGTFVITGSITDGSTYTDSVTITVSDRVVYLLGLTNEGTWTPTDSGNKANKMTYNSSTSLYELTINLYQSSTTYNGNNGFKIQDAGVLYGKNSTTLTTSSTSASGLTTSGGNLYITTKNIGGSSTVPYKFTYNASTKTVTVYYPMKVTFSKNGHGSSDPANQVIAYGGTASNPGTLTATDGYTHNGKWYTESSCTNEFSFSTAVTQDYNLYAKWTGAQKVLKVQAGIKTTSSGSYTLDDTTTAALTMDGTALTPAGDSGSKYQTKNVAVGDTCTLVAPNKGSGYTFLGWYNGNSRVSADAEYTYTHTMANADTTLVARYDRKYTLTIQNKTSNGTLGGGTSKTVFYDDTPASFTVTPATGYRINYAGSDNLSDFYSQPSATTGTVTVSGKSVANNKKVNTTIKVAYTAITPVITFASYKTSDNSNYSAGGGEITASYSTSSGGSGSSTSYPDRYLWWSASDNPAQHSNKIKMTADTDGNYYAAFTTGDNFYFNINDNSSSATSGSQKLNSSTSCDKDSNFQDWSTVGEWGGYYIGKGDLKTGTGVYIKFDPSANMITMKSSAFSYTAAGSGGGGSGTSGTVTSGGTVPYNANVTFTAEASATVDGNTYQFIGWYSTNNPAANATPLSTSTTYTQSSVTDNVTVYAIYRQALYLTFYNSYMRETPTSDWQFVAAPPRKVKVGMGTSIRATYSYKAGNEEQRGEEHTKNSTSDYYEGNRLMVLVGETVTLEFSTLASSDAIRGIFFNNSIRYSTETEPDNLYLNRVNQTGTGTLKDSENPDLGYTTGDDDWEYTYLPATTIYADENYYSGTTATTIHNNFNSYVAKNGVDQSAHTVTWVATQSYLNIDLELDYKYQLHINDDDPSGINIANMNDEGYYFGGEVIESTTADHTSGLKITLDNTTDTSGTYSFSSTTPVWKDKDGNTVSAPSGVTVTPYTSGNAVAGQASNIHHWLVYGTMPHSNLYLTIPVVKKYNMKLANIVVSDNGSNKRTMLTECSTNSTSATNCIGTISGKVNGTAQATLTDDGTYYTYDNNNNAGHVEVYTASSSNKYLNGGVNKGGYNVTAGDTVSYTFTWNSGKDAEYTFVGWFEGKLVDNTDYKFEPIYTKKLSGKETFTFTPTKNTIVMAVGTRDIYIGGNFTKDGAYTSTAANQTWSKNRPLMDFDPTYVNPSDPTKKGRYTYTFDSVTANTEYQFRCYDTVGTGASGQDTANLSVWSQWSGSDYANDPDDIFYGRHKYGAEYGYSHGAFVYKNNTNNWSLIDNTASDHDSNKNHQANGYAAPVTVYFYAYDGGMSVSSTYQWSRAYVSEGRGVDAVSVVEGASNSDGTTFNVPTASVNNKTVNNKDVSITTNTSSYGHDGKFEKIYECLVKEKDGQITVKAKPNDVNLEVQAFLVYNIETKASEAVKPESTVANAGTANAEYTGIITVPNNSKLYIVPIYKFTDAYITAKGLESHLVYVRADDIDKDDWGGLVSMYSWGTDARYDSGKWPGQLMIPSDDGASFYAPLVFTRGGLAGVTFNNYTTVYGGDFINFLGKYQDVGVSDVAYSNYTKPTADHNYIYQVFDYREPISIIENLNEKNPSIYDSEDMTLTFELKPGNKTAATIGNGAYNASFTYEYLTDSSGKYRVDLNGNKLSTYPTASYYVVCNYTEAYAPGGAKSYGFKDGSRDGTSTHNRYSIDWNVYDQNHVLVANGTQLSASFTDVYKSEMLTHIAKQLIDDGQPVSGKAVMIAYENPKVSSSDNTEAVRYSGQWYADGLNTIIEGNVRVGIYADGTYLPSANNSPGYATATVSFSPVAASGEALVQESGCTGNSLAKITKTHASKGDLQFRVSTTDNFLGWYRKTKDGDFEKIGSNYKLQAINPSFNEDITYYAFYSASASYQFKYKNRLGNDAYYSAKGSDVTDAEMGLGGILNATTRSADITEKLSKATTDISVFNKTSRFVIKNPDTTKPYTIMYTATQSTPNYTLTVYSYHKGGSVPTELGTVTGPFGTPIDVTNNKDLGNGVVQSTLKPSGQSDSVFLGWYEYDGTNWGTEVLSTQANFGFAITKNMGIAPKFGTQSEKDAITADTNWHAYIDTNEVTQELTDTNTGIIYNDSMVRFRYGADSSEKLPAGYKYGVLVMYMNDADYTANPGKLATNGLNTQAKAQQYLGSLTIPEGKNYAGARIGTSGLIAVKIQGENLSVLNRVDIAQGLDYAENTGGHYVVYSYIYNGSSYIVSNPWSTVQTYTVGTKTIG